MKKIHHCHKMQRSPFTKPEREERMLLLERGFALVTAACNVSKFWDRFYTMVYIETVESRRAVTYRMALDNEQAARLMATRFILLGFIDEPPNPKDYWIERPSRYGGYAIGREFVVSIRKTLCPEAWDQNRRNQAPALDWARNWLSKVVYEELNAT